MYAGPTANEFPAIRTRYFRPWTRISISVPSEMSCQHINNLIKYIKELIFYATYYASDFHFLTIEHHILGGIPVKFS